MESVARGLRVTKGSFYHHFKNRPDLLRAILDSWRKRQTLAVMERIDSEGNLDQRERILRALELPASSKAARDAASFELAIRAWARRDRLARDAVTAVDTERLAYVRSLLRAAGVPDHAAPTLAFLLYANNIGESLIIEDVSPAERTRRRAFVLELLVGTPKAPRLTIHTVPSAIAGRRAR